MDDDGDGLSDEDDPDCRAKLITCDDGDHIYRNCAENHNKLTGVTFQTINWYTEVVNQQLPELENEITLSLSFFRILNIQNCGSDCPLNRQTVPFSRRSIMVGLHQDMLANMPPSSYNNILAWGEDYQYFQNNYDPTLSDATRIGFFIIIAQPKSYPTPLGGHLVGKMDQMDQTAAIFLAANYFFTPLEAYVVAPNWVPMATGFEVENNAVNDGFDYIRIGQSEGWDASFIGDLIQMDIAETDVFSTVTTVSTSTTSTDTDVFEVELSSNIGIEFTDAISGERGYVFGASTTNENSRTASTAYAINSERVIPLGNKTFRYQDFPNSSVYPTLRSGTVGLGTTIPGSQGLNSFGHGGGYLQQYDRHPFSLRSATVSINIFGAPVFTYQNPVSSTSTPSYQAMIDGGPLVFIDLIRKSE